MSLLKGFKLKVMASKIVRGYLIFCGLLFNLFFIWMAAGWPLYFDRLLIVTDSPSQADLIICLTAGLGSNNLPTEDGWGRIYSAVQLYFDGYAPKVLFTGGGAEKVSEAEIYAEVARWFGCPQEAIEYEIGAGSTADHPPRLLELKSVRIEKTTPLLIVTSPLHARRTALCFKKQGFTSFKVIVNYRARKIADPVKVRELRVSQFPSYRPSGKVDGDIFMKLRWRSSYFFAALREVFAILVYKIKGYI
jgi:uncharacterized SAM-binding protein YcdF (DUF218 family)